MTTNVEKAHFGIITGVFMVAAFVLFSMGGNSIPFLKDLKDLNEIYFILLALLGGFLASQLFIWYYKRGLRRGRRNV